MSFESFDYSLPDEDQFYKTLLGWIQIKKEDELHSILKGGKCTFNPTSSYSRIRWNAYGLKIYFYLEMENIPRITDQIVSKVIKFSNEILVKTDGYDVIDVDFSPIITQPSENQSLMEDLNSTVKTLTSKIIWDILPKDVKEKGEEMTESYLYLYCVENALRLFVKEISEKEFGFDYFNKLKLNSDIRTKLSSRKDEETRSKWKRVRGDSDIFYLDFKDLITIIRNNWTIFLTYFPDQSWIETKINELADCRNLIAHNSYIDKHEKDVIRVNFNSILRQISSKI